MGRNVRLRSANRGNGNNAFNVNSSGNVNNNNASNANGVSFGFHGERLYEVTAHGR